ncbi:MAG: hypothetical protein SFX73_25265 [Kofleriaceae bacterium]|nr:hypothetical protein [Kofleriaceae bacterium]
MTPATTSPTSPRAIEDLDDNILAVRTNLHGSVGATHVEGPPR